MIAWSSLPPLRRRRSGVDPRQLEGAEIAPRALLATLTSAGYLAYTRNLLASLAPLGLREKALVFCADVASARALEPEGVRAIVLAEDGPETLQRYHRGRFAEVVRHKLAAVGMLLDRGYSVLFSDGDVVFLRDPTADLLAALASNEIVLQNDELHDSRITGADRTTLCTGFFMVRPTWRTRRLFDARRMQPRFACDQVYFNRRKRRLRSIGVLDRDVYPNGSHFLDREGVAPEDAKRRAAVVHFNHRVGDEKRREMERSGLWLLGAEAGSATALPA